MNELINNNPTNKSLKKKRNLKRNNARGLKLILVNKYVLIILINKYLKNKKS